MLTLDINNNFLVLDPASSILVRFYNPVCFFDKIPGDVGLEIQLPINEVNRAILGNPEMFEKYSSGSDQKFTGATLSWSGAVILSGTLVVQSAEETYDCWLQSDLGAMAEDQQEKLMNEMAWPEEQVFVDKETYDDATDDYGITKILNRKFWEGKGAETTIPYSYVDVNGVIKQSEEARSILSKYMDEHYASYVNNLSLHPGTILQGAVLSPYLHLRYVIKESLRLNKWYIDRDDMYGGDLTGDKLWLKNLKIYNNFNIIDLAFTTERIEVNSNDQWIGEYASEEVKFIRYLEWQLVNFNYRDLLPRKSYKDFILGLQNFTNYIFHFRNDKRVDIIDRNEVLNTTSIDLNEYFIGKWNIGERKNVTLKFVSEYDKDDQLYDANFKDLSDRWQDFGEAVNTKDELLAIASPVIGELRMVNYLNEIYEYRWKVIDQSEPTQVEDQIDVLGWEFVSTGPQPFLYGDADEIETIESAISTLQQFYIGISFTPTLSAVQKGNINAMRSQWNDFTLRLIPDNVALLLKSLYWDSSLGLFKTRWIKFARFWKNRLPVSASFNMPMNIVDYVARNITNKFRTNNGEFIIEEMEVEFKLNSIGKTKIKGYKI